MSEEKEAVDTCCASCGIAQNDDIKLRKCTACYLVKYCSIKCQKDHRKQHKRDCKKRAAELRDEILFKQPEGSHYGDCPICCLPLSLDPQKSSMWGCCGKVICNGCRYANTLRETDQRLTLKCPFCREPLPSEEEACKQNMKRVEANDPVVIRHEGGVKYKQGDYQGAFNYYKKAAELGDVAAHFSLADLYHCGHGVEKDKGKVIHHIEEAAIGGHPEARRNLGVHEWNNGNYDRAVKHFIIAATQGEDDSIKALMNAFKGGFVSKEDLDATLRAHKAAVDATKSPQRHAAEKIYQRQF